MKKLLTSLALGVAFAASASAAVLLDESFDYARLDGETLLDVANSTPSPYGGWYKTFATTFNYESTSLDGVGGAGFLDLGSAARTHVAPTRTVGEIMSFSFLLNVDNFVGTTARNGSRILFEGAGTSSNFGYGINFDVAANDTVTSYARVGQVNNAVGAVTFTGTVLVAGTFTRTAEYAGDLTVNYYNGVGFTSLIGSQSLLGGSWTLDTTTPTPAMVVRNAQGDLNITIDNIDLSNSVAAVPEPSAFAALAGLGALGFAALRRRRA